LKHTGHDDSQVPLSNAQVKNMCRYILTARGRMEQSLHRLCYRLDDLEFNSKHGQKILSFPFMKEQFCQKCLE